MIPPGTATLSDTLSQNVLFHHVNLKPQIEHIYAQFLHTQCSVSNTSVLFVHQQVLILALNVLEQHSYAKIAHVLFELKTSAVLAESTLIYITQAYLTY